MLMGMMGGGAPLDQVLRVLRKHKGDVQKAADAILSGDNGEEPPLWQSTLAQDSTPAYRDPPTTPTNNALALSGTSVIDLTAEGTDFTSNTKFGPSERAPDPGWQMVTTAVSAACIAISY